MKKLDIGLFLSLGLMALSMTAGVAADRTGFKPYGLRTDMLEHTDCAWQNGYRLGYSIADCPERADRMQFAAIRSSRPTFSWEFISCGDPDPKYYRIILSDNRNDIDSLGGNIWDSGRVDFNGESMPVLYGAETPLEADRNYFWRVALSDGDNDQWKWSDVKFFRTANELDEFGISDYPVEKLMNRPVEISEIGDNIYFADFGKDAFGQLLLTVTAVENDTLSISLGERLVDGRILRNPGISSVRYRRQLLPVSAGTHHYRMLIEKDRRNTGRDAVLMPDYIGEVMPFRYCEIEGMNPRTSVNSLSREVATYPFDMSASCFECSDDTLNMVWDLCKYSIQATSFTGLYVDGDRERIPYEADALINQLCHYGVDASYGMARSTLDHLMKHPTWPTEWILQTVMIAWEDYMYTGDSRMLEKYYDRLKSNTLLSLRADNGLVSATIASQSPEFLESIGRKETIRDIVDWPRTNKKKNDQIWEVPGESDGFEFTDYNAVVNAFHFRAMELMGMIADALGRTDDARSYKDESEAFRKRFIRMFYDRKNHRFADGVLADTRHAALHSNMLPVAFGMADAFADRELADYIRSRGMACSVYGAQFLADAAYEMGDGDYGLKLLTETGDRGWYNMIRSGSTITTEAWDDRYKTNQDWNHAWGAVPANIIPRRLLGVTPAEPGFKVADIRPQTGSLEWVRGKVPTIRGAINMDVRNADGCYRLTVDIPSGMDADVSLPTALTSGRSVSHNGEKLALRVDKNKPFVSLGRFSGGSHCFEVK